MGFEPMCPCGQTVFKTASTMVCIVIMFLPIPAPLNWACIAVIVATTIWSGVEYFVKNKDCLSDM